MEHNEHDANAMLVLTYSFASAENHEEHDPLQFSVAETAVAQRIRAERKSYLIGD